MKILSIDIGSIFGVGVHDGEKIIYTEEWEYKTLLELFTYTKELIFRWKPSVILIPYPTRYYNVLQKHFKMIGVIECVAEYRDILTIECNDATCKKAVLGKGNAKKADILSHYTKNGMVEEIGTDSEHVLDAVMFIDWYRKSTD